MKYSAFALAFCLACSGPSMIVQAQEKQALGDIAASGLTGEQAKKIVSLVAHHLNYDATKPGMELEGPLLEKNGQPIQPGYYHFGLHLDQPKSPTRTVLGFYAVSVKTGDVWDVEQCKRYEFPELLGLQNDIMQKTGASMPLLKTVWDSLGCEPVK